MPDPTEEVREDLHDAVDAAVDAAERDRRIEDRFASLERMFLERPASVDTSGIEASIAALGDRFESRLTALEASATTRGQVSTGGDDSDDGDELPESVDDAVDDVKEAVDDVTDPADLDQRIAAAGNLKVDGPEIPERPPIKSITHPIFRRLWGK